MTSAELRSALAQHSGTQTYTSYSYSGATVFRMTDGVVDMRDKAQAYWLIDAIASHQTTPNVRAERFQAWHLKHCGKNSGAMLKVTDGNSSLVIATQRIAYTEFPLDDGKSFDLWLVDGVLMLPGGY